MLRRGFIPPVKGGGTGGFRGVGDDIPTPNTIPGGYPKAGSGTSGSDIPRIGKGDDGSSTYKPPIISQGDAFSSPNQYGTGSASSSTSLCARNENTCDEMKDVAEELVGQIMDAITDTADDDESPPVDLEPTATAARNVSTVAPTPTPIPNLNVSSWMDLYDYRTLFTEEEYSMLQEDPLCFYANFGRLYENYAFESRTSTGSAPEETSTTTTPTALAKPTARPMPRDDSPTDCLGCEYNDDDPDAPVTATGIHEGKARTLYLSYLPDQLRIVYTSTPTSLTVTTTATTTCSGLGGLGISDFETPYVVFGYREGYAPTEIGSADGASSVTSGGASGREELMPLTGFVALGLLWLSRFV